MACKLDIIKKNNIDEAISKFIGNGQHFKEVREGVLVGTPSSKFDMFQLETIVNNNLERTQKWINAKFNNNPKFTTNWINVIKNQNDIEIKFNIPKLLEIAWQSKLDKLDYNEANEILQEYYNEINQQDVINLEKEDAERAGKDDFKHLFESKIFNEGKITKSDLNFIKEMSEKYGIDLYLKSKIEIKGYDNLKYIAGTFVREGYMNEDIKINISTKQKKHIKSSVVHEYLHPFIEIIEVNNKKAFENFYKEALKILPQETVDFVNKSYPEYYKKEEIIVRAVTKQYDDEVKENNLLKKILNWVSSFFYKNKENKTSTLQDITENTTINELYNIFKNYGNIEDSYYKNYVKQNFLNTISKKYINSGMEERYFTERSGVEGFEDNAHLYYLQKFRKKYRTFRKKLNAAEFNNAEDVLNFIKEKNNYNFLRQYFNSNGKNYQNKNFNNLVKNTTEKFSRYNENIDELKENYSDQLKSILFNGQFNNVSAKDVLNNILNNNILNKDYNEIINKLALTTKANIKFIQNSDLKNSDTFMQFNSLNNNIEISLDKLSDINSIEQGLLNFIHEVFHERTLRIINRPKNKEEKKLVEDFTKLYNNIKNNKIYNTYNHELSSLEEFTAGLLSNKDFRKAVNINVNLQTNFFNKLINFFKNLFGIQNNNILNNLLQLVDTSNEVFISNEIFESKIQKGTIYKRFRDVNKTLDEKIENTLYVLQEQSSRNEGTNKFKSKINKTSKQINSIKNKLGKDTNEYKIELIDIFSNFMKDQLTSINYRLNQPKVFNSRIFNSSKSYIDSFSNLQNDIEKTLEELKNNDYITDEQYLEKLNILSNLEGLTSQAERKILKAGKKYIENNASGFITGYKEVELEYRDKYKKEAINNNVPKNKIDSYVNKKMSENRQEIKNNTLKSFRELIDNPILDIKQMSYLVNSEKDLLNPIIQIFSAILDKVQNTFDNIIQPKLLELQKDTENFINKNRLKSSDEIYKKLVTTSEDGEIFLRGEYKIEYYNIVKKLRNNIFNAELKFGEYSDEHKEAMSEYSKFKIENTVYINEYMTIPSDKWLDNLSDLSKEEKDYLNKIQELAIESNDKYITNVKSLKKTMLYANFYKLPSVRKDLITNLKKGNIIETAKEYYKEQFTQQIDQTDLGDIEQISKDKNTYQVYTDMSGKEINYVPIHFRAKLEPKYQSIDLATLYALEYQNAVKYNEKNKVTSDLVMFKEVISENKFYKTQGIGNKIVTNKATGQVVLHSKEDAFLIKKLESMLNNRLYDKTSEYAGQIAGKDVNKIESFLRSTISKASMALNLISAPANLVTGKSQSFLEILRDPNLTNQDVLSAEKFYYSNTAGFLNDLGKNVYNSLGNQILLSNGGLVSYGMLQNNFEKNKTLSLTGTKPLFFLQEAGEHHIQGIHTFTILSSAKILDKDGNYLNKDGEIVDDKSKAASILDLYQLNDKGELEISLKNKTFYTNFDTINPYNLSGKDTLRSYIASSLIKSQGQYSRTYQSEAERHFFGKALYHFKKHIISPSLSRWRGLGTNVIGKEEDIVLNYNYNLMRPDEGNYVTTLRWLRYKVLPTIKSLQLKMLLTDFNQLDDWEKGNIKKTFSELALVTTFSSLALLFASAAGDDDDLFWYAATVFRRLESEAAQYYDVNEAWRVLKNPISTLNFLEDSNDVVSSLLNVVDPLEDDKLNNLYDETTDLVKYIPGNKMFKESKKAYDYLNRN